MPDRVGDARDRYRPLRRVAIVSDWCLPRRGGIESHIHELAANLTRAGIDATILTSIPGPAEIDGVKVDRVATPLLPIGGIAVSPFLVRTIQDRLAAGDYDLVHAHPSQVPPMCFAAVVAAGRLGIPAVVTFHSMMKVLAPLLAASERWLGWPSADLALSAVSRFVAKQMADAMPHRSIDVLPNGFEAAFWRPRAGEPRKPARQLRLVSAMRLEGRKRPLALLDIFARAAELAAPAGDLSLTIAGDGSLRNRLEEHTHRLRLSDRVTFAGWLDRTALRRLYLEADMFVMPSRKESFCIAALEARATGLPVVGMARTGLNEFVRDGENGELARDDADMARRIAALASDRSRLARLAADESGLERFAWQNLTDEHIAAYRELISRRQPGSI